MFWTHYRLRLKSIVVNRSTFFWCAIFPFILSTLFYVSFGSSLSDKSFSPVPAAVVIQGESEEKTALLSFLKELERQEVLKITVTNAAEASALLEEEHAAGIIEYHDALRLILRSSGIEQSILKSVLDSYQRKSALFADIARENPAGLEAAAGMSAAVFAEDTTLSGRPANSSLQFFYALVAMSCMYASFYGLVMSADLQGNLSPLAVRRTLAPVKRWKMICGDYLAVLTVAVAVLLLLFAYLAFGLGIDFGSHILLTVFTGIVGCMFGIAFGILLGSTNRQSLSAKIGISVSICMSCCFLAGQMINLIPVLIEKYVPVINRINPAQLIANSFYCLAFYDDYTRYTLNIVTLAVLTIAMGCAGILLMRRKKYASI